MIKFSIIMAAYNAENYIIECIHSVLENSYSNFELIIINDGSSDATVPLINSINDSRIYLINTKHVGTADAKNEGIKRATGDYILFIDADDLFSTDIISSLANEVQRTRSDFYIFQWVPFRKKIGDSDLYPRGNQTIDGMGTAIWNKLYARELIKQVKFPQNTIFEDVAFSAQVYLRANRITFISRVLYYYRQHNNSLTKKGHEPAEHLDIITDFNYLIEDIKADEYNVSADELYQIGILIHRLTLDHIKSILRENKMAKNTIFVLNKLVYFLEETNTLFKDIYSRNKIENLKGKILVKLIKLHGYKLARIIFNWKQYLPGHLYKRGN